MIIVRTGEERTEAADGDKAVIGRDDSIEIGLVVELKRRLEAVAGGHDGTSPAIGIITSSC